MSYTTILGSSKHMSGPNGPITRIVLHATVSPCVVGGARNVARYFQSDSAGGLAHFVVDPSEIIQCCPEDTACWHAPPNHGSIGVELCDPQSGPASRWTEGDHARMLARAAILVADLCKRLGVPVVYIDAPGLIAGRHGITMHSDVSAAFHQSTHTDPGEGFPMAHFLDLVRAAAAPVVKPQDVVTPTPVNVAPTYAPEETAMLIVKNPTGPDVWAVRLDLSGRSHIADQASLDALLALPMYHRVTLSSKQLASIPVLVK